MPNTPFNYELSADTRVFYASLTTEKPYVATKKRNHESLFFVTNGSLIYEKGGEKNVIENGQVGYIARGSVDKSSPYMCANVSYIAINFAFSDEESPKSSLPFDFLCSKHNIYDYEKLFTKAHTVYQSDTPARIALCNSVVLQIIGSLYNEHKTDKKTILSKSKIAPSVEYLRCNYHNAELEIRALSEMAGMSEKNFRRLFYEIYRKTPYAYLQELRMSKAETSLLSTEKSISEIAALCGFGDVYAFSHCFKKHHGFSPTEYRKNNTKI